MNKLRNALIGLYSGFPNQLQVSSYYLHMFMRRQMALYSFPSHFASCLSGQATWVVHPLLLAASKMRPSHTSLIPRGSGTITSGQLRCPAAYPALLLTVQRVQQDHLTQCLDFPLVGPFCVIAVAIHP